MKLSMLILILFGLCSMLSSMEETQVTAKDFPFFLQLPPEIQVNIIFLVSYNTATLFQALKNIKTLQQVNKFFLEFTNDPFLTKKNN